jgi:hypothetical protein
MTFIIFIYYMRVTTAFNCMSTEDGDTKGDECKMEEKRQRKQVSVPEFPSACSC